MNILIFQVSMKRSVSKMVRERQKGGGQKSTPRPPGKENMQN